jgi:hypothetical protein
VRVPTLKTAILAQISNPATEWIGAKSSLVEGSSWGAAKVCFGGMPPGYRVDLSGSR